MSTFRLTSTVVGCMIVSILAAAPQVHAADAIEPGQVQTRGTWACIGINWHFTGDDNRNATVNVEFRRAGTTEWRQALPLWLHEFEQTRMFSGSIFRLSPDTEYEIKLSMRDPDGGNVDRVVTASTQAYPRMPTRTVSVRGGLEAAQKLATPGTVMLLQPGTYPATVLNVSGKPGAPIVYRPAGNGQVIIEGLVRIQANHVWLHGLTIRDPKNAIVADGRGVIITGCNITSHYTIHTPRGADDFFVADNVLIGDCGGRFTFGGEGVDFGSDRGGGHAVCYNRMTDLADGVSYGGNNIDVYCNYIHETVDDFIEPDYARENYRIWENRCYNSMCGLSFQPMKGGPWYMFDNIIVGNYLHALKVKTITGPTVLYGNTMLTKSAMLGQAADVMRGTLVNNLWLRATPGPLGEGGSFRPGANPTTIDYNAYGNGQEELFRRINYTDLAQRNGWDRNSIRVKWDEVFQEPVKVPAGNPRYGQDIHGAVIPDDWKFEHHLLLPRPDSPIINAGTILPNLTGPFLGSAPDIGAHQAGLGTAWYGPRVWDDQAQLVYGRPEGWQKLPASRAGDFADLGCPTPQPNQRRTVLLAGESPRVFALLTVERATGEARWTGAREFVADDASAQTPILDYQDGFYIRLYIRDGNALLLASRVEPDGILRVTVGCAEADLPSLRTTMFQFARSLFR